MDQFAIRPARLEDKEELQNLMELSIRALSKDKYTTQQIDGSIGSVFGVDTQLIKDGTYFVAVPKNDPTLIVACGGWSYRKTAWGSDNAIGRISEKRIPGQDAASIRAMYVRPGHERKGLGSLILKHAENAAREAGFTKFELGSTLPGYELYSRYGYQKATDIEVPLSNGVMLQVIKMEKDA